MKTLRIILKKEFRQIFRNSLLLKVIFVAPLLQLIVLPWAANYEIKNISLVVVDTDRSGFSRELVSKISASGYFVVKENTSSYEQAMAFVERDEADILLQIPTGFEKKMVRESHQKLLMVANAINGTKAIVGSAYLGSVIRDYNGKLRTEWLNGGGPAGGIEITSSNWFNPAMNYQVFMVPGILVMLVTMVGGMMSALNIVKEKEIGTIEQINVTPIRKYQFILGKLIPFWIIGMLVFSIGLLISRILYGIIPEGNLLLLYAFLAVYLIAVLGFGLLVSTYSETQQQAISIIFFFLMVFNLMSGLFTPIESMPEWAQWIARINPLTYFIDVMRMVVLKGSGLRDVWSHLAVIGGMAVFVNFWAVLNYRKTS
ncbi:MAG: ABC transporter permease [Bacteroidetes bacterium]|nr:MAG: ABC transporter permease [Bacteroidota bacterium]